MKCVILCGGKATRIKSKVKNKNKCFIEIDGKSVMQRNIEWLQSYGIYEVIFAMKPNVGTAGALLESKGLLDKDFIVINGDTIQVTDLNAMIVIHLNQKGKDKGNEATVLTNHDFNHNSGVFIFKSTVLKRIEDNKFYNLSDLLNATILTEYHSHDPYFDVGTPAGLIKARNYFYQQRKHGKNV